MKKAIWIFASAILISCSDNPVQKPDDLLSENEMENILYDVTIQQAAENYKVLETHKKGISLEFIYKKYNIDSTVYNQNQRYYASDVKGYKHMHDRVLKRIQEEKTILDSAKVKKNKPEKPDPQTLQPASAGGN